MWWSFWKPHPDTILETPPLSHLFNIEQNHSGDSKDLESVVLGAEPPVNSLSFVLSHAPYSSYDSPFSGTPTFLLIFYKCQLTLQQDQGNWRLLITPALGRCDLFAFPRIEAALQDTALKS